MFACSRGHSDAAKRITPEYDKQSGRLQLLKYDSNGNGKVDMWSYMDGPRVVRVEIDKDEDGKIDRWEHYDADQKLASVEEDTDGDGRPDKWETYEGERLAIVAFDTQRRGKPDRRLVYGPNGSARVEVDPDGTGRFTPVRDQ